MDQRSEFFSLKEIKHRLERLLEYYREYVGGEEVFVRELETRLANTRQALGQYTGGHSA